jgi:comEA protein
MPFSPRYACQICSILVLFCLAYVVRIDATTKKPPLKPININTASSEELQQVPGIGPATAEKILQMRKSYGPFKSVDDLLAIKGLGRKRLDKMRKYLTVGKSSASAKPATKPASPESTQQSEPPPI